MNIVLAIHFLVTLNRSSSNQNLIIFCLKKFYFLNVTTKNLTVRNTYIYLIRKKSCILICNVYKNKGENVNIG